MNAISRRHALRLTGFAAVAAASTALAGCVSSSTTNGVTTITVNTATISAYASGLSLVATALGAGLTIAGVGAAVAPAISGIGAMAAQDAKALATATNGQQTFSFNTTSAPAFVTSLLTDATSLKAELNALGTALPPTVQTYYNAAMTIASAVQSALSLATAVAAPAPGGMSVSDALAVVHVKAP